MKITIILFFFLLTFSSCSIYDLDEEILSEMPCSDTINLILGIKKDLESMTESEKELELNQIIIFLLKKIVKIHKNNKECIRSLEDLFPILKKGDLSGSLINGISYIGKYFEYLINKKVEKNIESFETCRKIYLAYFVKKNRIFEILFPSLVARMKQFKFKENFVRQFVLETKQIKNMNLNYGTLLKGLKYFNILSTVYSTVSMTYNKFNSCKNRNLTAFLKSSFQGVAKTGTNTAFGAFGSFLGTFIPIPVFGTIVGGMTGNFIGNIINSFYELDC